jgi:dipeptidyl-peptidase-4
MSYKRAFCFILLVIFLMLSLLLTSGWTQKKKITYSQAFQRGEPRLLASLPRIQGWLDDENYLQMRSDEEDEKARPKLMKVNVTTGEASIYFDEEKYKDKLPKGFSFQAREGRTEDYTGFIFNRREERTEDYTGFIFNRMDDLYYFSTKTNLFKQLTATPVPEKNPHFSPDGKYVAFTRNNNLYVLDIASGLELQLTNDGSDTIYNGWASWVYYEEILGRASRYAAFWWSPNSEMIAFLRFDDSPVPTFPLFDAEGVHGKLEITRYPEAGDSNPYVRLGIYHLKNNKLVCVDIEDKADHYVAWPFWTRDSKQLFFQWMNRRQDNIKIYSADPETGTKTEIYDERQDSWVEFFENLYFFKDGSGFLLKSDMDGWAHLYYYDLKGNLKYRLTDGDWAVNDVILVDEKHGTVYFSGSKENSTEIHLYSVSLKGKNLKRLTKVPGTHRCQVSPGGKYFIDTYENIQQPGITDLYSTDGKLIRNLGDEKTDLLNEYDLGKVELFTIPSGDGYNLPAIWVLPPNFDESKRYPVLFQIYSGPASPTVSTSYPQIRWHYYAQHDIIVISVDHRGSGHFGKKGVALMYRNLGKWEMNDLIAAVKWLRNKPFVDPDRMGITGGSYGGYTTCMALTYGADYFTHGVAEYSVTDWRLYDTVYTERYMNTPDENPKGYEFGSVMTHADKYKGNLLVIHGTLDDNVHMQNTIQLIDKLEDLNKDFELMLYPNARHGVRGVKRAHATREDVQFWFRHFLGKELNVNE